MADGRDGAVAATMRWYSTGLFWIALAFINAIPILAAPLPMMPDVFNDIGRYYVTLHQDDALLRSYYAVHETLSSNSGVDLLMLGLGQLLPIEEAVRLVVAAIALLCTVGIYVLAKAAHGKVPASALLAVPFVWSFPFVFGFLNYWFGFALALLGAAVWLRTRDLPPWVRVPIDLATAFVLWFFHLVAFGIFLIICGCYSLAMLRSADARRAWLRTIVDLALLAWPLLLSVVPGPATVPLFSGAWEPMVKVGLALQVFRSINKVVDRATLLLLVGCAAALLALTRSGRVRFGYPLLGASLVLAVLWAAFPEAMMGSYYSDLRLLPVVFILFFVSAAIEPSRWANGLALIALLLTVGRLALVSVDWVKRSHLAERDLQALSLVPEGSRIAVFAADSGCSAWRLSSHDTLPSLAINRRRSFVNTEWDIPGATWLRPIYNRGRGYNDNLSVQIASPNYPKCHAARIEERLAALPRERFDFVWVFDAQFPAASYPWLSRRFAGSSGTLYAINKS
jgi:hypothetical protein